jgi:elongation factor P
MLTYNQIKPKKVIIFRGEPWQVLSSNVAKRTKQKPVNQTKLKNLITGVIINESFKQSDNVEEADIEYIPLTFIYSKGGEWWFYRNSDKSYRIFLSEDLIGEKGLFLKKDMDVKGLSFSNDGQEKNIFDIELPIKESYAVKDAPPNIKGNTASGGTKSVIIESGAIITTPLFIEKGDIIEVNTESKEYVTRVDKA